MILSPSGLPFGMIGGTQPPVIPLDPRDTAALMAGGIWLTSVASPSPATWNSQATQTNNFLTAGASDDPPVLVTPPSGAKYWDLTSTNTAKTYFPFFYMTSPGSALWGSSSKQSIAFWAKMGVPPAAAPAATQAYLFSQWPSSNEKRWEAWVHDEGPGAFFTSVNGSPDGTAVDPNVRWKFNGADYRSLWETQWMFLRFTYDASGTNYTQAGGNFSTRFRMYVNGQLDDGQGYSAGSQAPDGLPPVGPVRTPLYGSAATAPLVWPIIALRNPGNPNGGPRWQGYYGHIYFTGGDLDLTDHEWNRVMAWDPPTA